MLNLDLALNRAKARLNVKSDRALCSALGLTTAAVCDYRKGKALPSPDTIVKLCQILEEDPAPYLADLHATKETGAARPIYERIAQILREHAA